MGVRPVLRVGQSLERLDEARRRERGIDELARSGVVDRLARELTSVETDTRSLRRDPSKPTLRWIVPGGSGWSRSQ